MSGLIRGGGKDRFTGAVTFALSPGRRRNGMPLANRCTPNYVATACAKRGSELKQRRASLSALPKPRA
eukprot:8318253-Alexandrium_andersonii.AAC.1